MRTHEQIAHDALNAGFSNTGMAMLQIAKELDSIHRETFKGSAGNAEKSGDSPVTVASSAKAQETGSREFTC